MTDQQPDEIARGIKVITDWQAQIHHELKALNSKITFFVIIVVIGMSLTLLNLCTAMF